MRVTKRSKCPLGIGNAEAGIGLEILWQGNEKHSVRVLEDLGKMNCIYDRCKHYKSGNCSKVVE